MSKFSFTSHTNILQNRVTYWLPTTNPFSCVKQALTGKTIMILSYSWTRTIQYAIWLITDITQMPKTAYCSTIKLWRVNTWSFTYYFCMLCIYRESQWKCITCMDFRSGLYVQHYAHRGCTLQRRFQINFLTAPLNGLHTHLHIFSEGCTQFLWRVPLHFRPGFVQYLKKHF